jgi:hypothetical protein
MCTIRYDFSVYAEDSSGSVVSQTDQTLYVKYVRRELRSLSDDDKTVSAFSAGGGSLWPPPVGGADTGGMPWQAFFDAAQTLWQTDATTGQAKYGDDYEDIDYFVEYHLENAADMDCDHIHDGLGFMTQARPMLHPH